MLSRDFRKQALSLQHFSDFVNFSAHENFFDLELHQLTKLDKESVMVGVGLAIETKVLVHIDRSSWNFDSTLNRNFNDIVQIINDVSIKDDKVKEIK